MLEEPLGPLVLRREELWAQQLERFFMCGCVCDQGVAVGVTPCLCVSDAMCLLCKTACLICEALCQSPICVRDTICEWERPCVGDTMCVCVKSLCSRGVGCLVAVAAACLEGPGIAILRLGSSLPG